MRAAVRDGDPALARRRLAAQVGAGLPELGWSVSEVLFVPLLLKLHVPAHLLTICWLFSPLFGLVLHPLVGAQADIHGRRPFIVLFGLVAAAGLAIMPLCAEVPNGAALAILAFAVADTGHDLLCTPTVAQMNDLFDADDSEHRCAVMAGFGKMFGLLCAACLDSSLAFRVVAGTLALASLLQLAAPREVMCPVDLTEVGCFGPTKRVVPPPGFYAIFMLQFAGWLSVNMYSFYISSAWAQESGAMPGSKSFEDAVSVATTFLMAGAVWFTVVGSLLPKIVALFGGEVEALIAALLAFVFMFSTFSHNVLTQIGAVFIYPVAYQVIARVPFSWIERQASFDEGDRGQLTGRLTTTLSAAQIVVAVCGGPVTAHFDGRLVGAFRVCAVVVAMLAFAAFVNLLMVRSRVRAGRVSSVSASPLLTAGAALACRL